MYSHEFNCSDIKILQLTINTKDLFWKVLYLHTEQYDYETDFEEIGKTYSHSIFYTYVYFDF